MKEKILYIFKDCECFRDDFKIIGNLKVCLEHETRMCAKVRMCHVCGCECVVSPRCNSEKYACDECRTAYNRSNNRVYQRSYKPPTQYDQKEDPDYIDKRTVPSYRDQVAEILDKRFPPIKMPVMSDRLKRVLSI